jgi:SpoVK/Ycf46/Vps4 family AAA+-type ATPase
MLAKAIAKEARATFINVRLSSIMNKWFGESNKLIDAIFSLAVKLSPSVIFIDELDTFLNQRDGTDGSCVSSMKSEFLTLWDGMTTDPDKPVMVLGATNRPHDIDTAILRRLPRTFEIGLPKGDARLQILKLILEKQEMTNRAKSCLAKLANVTKGYSGSDLKELCRAAAMEPVRDITRKGVKVDDKVKVRPVDAEDFVAALKKVKRSGESAREFGSREAQFSKRGGMIPVRQDDYANDFMKGMRLLQTMMNNSTETPVIDVEQFSDCKEDHNGDDDVPDLDFSDDEKTSKSSS